MLKVKWVEDLLTCLRYKQNRDPLSGRLQPRVRFLLTFARRLGRFHVLIVQKQWMMQGSDEQFRRFDIN
jgi:hypothetical protein